MWVDLRRELAGRPKPACPRCKKLFEMQSFCISAAAPACGPTIFTGLPRCFCISTRHPCMSARHFDQSRLEPPPLHVGAHFHRLLFFYFTIFISIGFHAGGFCISSRHPCMHVGPPFSPICRAIFLFCYFTISFPFGSRQEVSASRVATPACRAAIFHQSAGPFTILFFYDFMSIVFQAGGFCILSHHPCMSAPIFTGYCFSILLFSFPLGSMQEAFASRAATPACMSARHFHQSAGPFYYFAILRYHFPLVPGRRFLHLESPHLHVGSPFFTSPPDRLPFYSFTISCPLGSRQEVFASGAATPARRAAIFHRSAGPFTILLFYDFMSIGFHPGRRLLHLEPSPLHVGPQFSPVRRTVYYFLLFYDFMSTGCLHLELPPLHGGPQFSPARLLFFDDLMSTRFHAGGFCISRRHPGMSTRHFHRPATPPVILLLKLLYYFTILLFYYFTMFIFISIGFKAGSFCISNHRPCMSALVFLHLGPPILHVRWTLRSPRTFLHLGPPTLHVGSRFCMSAKRIPFESCLVTSFIFSRTSSSLRPFDLT